MEITYVRIGESADGSRPALVHLMETRDSTTTLCGAEVEPGSTLLWTGDPAQKSRAGALPEGVDEACSAAYFSRI
jgi:hypothetical protein